MKWTQWLKQAFKDASDMKMTRNGWQLDRPQDDNRVTEPASSAGDAKKPSTPTNPQP